MHSAIDVVSAHPGRVAGQLSIFPASWFDDMLSKRHNVLEMTMTTQAIRSTLYLEPGLHQALRLKAATAHRSMSEIVNDAVRASLQEDEEDLAAFSGRSKEKTMSYEQLLAKLKADGSI
ncbi:MAG: hypothetical protein NT042_11265 [Sulfuritalea sp.]|nr:hypothetical protein [Sulfuritalea sp.]